MPGNHPTREEMDSRLNEIVTRMGKGQTLGQINQWLKAEFGLSTRSCANYLSRARKRILEKTGRTEEDMRVEALAFYEGVRGTETNGMFYRMKAQERIDSLMGLEKPKKVAVTDASGNGPATIRIEAARLQSLPEAELAKLAEAHSLLEQVARDQSQQAGGTA